MTSMITKATTKNTIVSKKHRAAAPAAFRAVALLAPLVCSCAPGSYLAGISEDCKKYVTPDARMACELKYKESARDFERYREQRKSLDNDADGNTSNTGSLCFKQSNGEIMCPN